MTESNKVLKKLEKFSENTIQEKFKKKLKKLKQKLDMNVEKYEENESYQMTEI